MAAVGPMFGISRMQSIRAGMLLAAGGEFAFVAFGARPQQPVPCQTPQIRAASCIMPAQPTAVVRLSVVE